MKRLALAFAPAAAFAVLASFAAQAVGPFDTKLSADRQIVQALNRLTFGPRPGDVEEVRRIGIQKWIDLQLHPESITENPLLETRLQPYETLRMDFVTVLKDYMQNPQMMMMNPVNNAINLLSQEERRKVMNGTAEERRAALAAMDPDKRKQVLLTLPPTNLESIPEYKKEAEDARKAQIEAQQAENRKRNPQLPDLLTPEQLVIARRGDPEELKALFSELEPEKMFQVASVLPPQSGAWFPDLRREGLRKRPAPATGELRSARRQAAPRGVFQPATGRSAGRFLVQSLQRL